MDKKSIKAKKREILGRKVKRLRKEGQLPGNVYGKKEKSKAVVVDMKVFNDIYAEVGETGVLEMEIEGEKDKKNVLIKNTHKDPVTEGFLHADFQVVDLTEKMVVGVPVEIIGEALAVKENKGVLLTLLNEIEVEALPTDLPESIEVEVGNLKELNEEIKVGDLKVGAKVKILTESNQIVAKIGQFMKEEVEEKPVEVVEGEEGDEEKGEEGEEGEEKKEGDGKKEDGKEKKEGK